MKILKLWLPVIGWGGLMFYLSSIPGLSSGLPYDYFLRKMAHITEYAILTFVLYRAFKGTWNLGPGLLVLWPSLIAYLYAASDEYHQLFVAHRHGAFSDTLIDAIGIVVFFFLQRFISVK